MPAEPPHGLKFSDKGLHPLDDADGGEREERAAQPQDAEAENQRQRAHADAGGEQAQAERQSERVTSQTQI